MNNIYRPLTALLMVGLLCGGGYVLWNAQRPTSICHNLRCISMSHTNSYQLQELYSDTPDIYRALFSKDKNRIRIEARRVPKASSMQQMNESVTRIKAMFENAPAPYPGELSNTVVCDQKFIPTYEEIHENNTPISLFVGYLNNRLTFGSCSQNQAVYRDALAFIYCPAQSLLIRLELIASTEDFALQEKELLQQIKTLQCNE